MRRPATVLLLATLLALAAFTLAAFAGRQDGPEADSLEAKHRRPHQRTCDQIAPPPFFRSFDMTPDDGIFTARLPPPLILAGLLSAAETGLGINTSQIDIWREFSAAMMDFSLQSPGMPQDFGGNNGTLLDGLEKMAEDAERNAAEAKALKAAIQALKAELTTAQIHRLARLHSVRDHHIWSPRGNATHPRPCPMAHGD